MPVGGKKGNTLDKETPGGEKTGSDWQGPPGKKEKMRKGPCKKRRSWAGKERYRKGVRGSFLMSSTKEICQMGKMIQI